MRTTLNIAEDVLLAAKELGRREHKTTGQVLTELARKGLSRRPAGNASEPVEEFLGFRPLPSRGLVVTSELVEKLLEEELI